MSTNFGNDHVSNMLHKFWNKCAKPSTFERTETKRKSEARIKIGSSRMQNDMMNTNKRSENEIKWP